MQENHQDYEPFLVGNPYESFICDWHPGWGVRPKVYTVFSFNGGHGPFYSWLYGQHSLGKMGSKIHPAIKLEVGEFNQSETLEKDRRYEKKGKMSAPLFIPLFFTIQKLQYLFICYFSSINLNKSYQSS